MTATDTPRRVGNPYVGPASFRLGDPLYGRDREREDLLDLLIAERIVLLYSPSGAGKTSLIQAALIPALQEAEFEVLPIIRVTHAIEPEPGMPAPRNRYVMSVLLSLEEGVPPASQRPVAELATLTLRDYLAAHADRDGRPGNEMLIFDQFEEVLTADPTDEPAKHEFFKELGQTLRDRGHWALFSMREDFLAALDPYLRHVPTRFRTTFRLDLLSVDQALEAIRRPAEQAGVDFTEEAAHRLVDDLRRVRVQRPDGGTEDAVGTSVEPVQLQVTCRQLWSVLPPDATGITPADVEALGDVDRALADYYADRVARAAERTGLREAAIREWVEDCLITPQGLRGQVLEGPAESGEAGYLLLGELVDAHLVRAEMRRQATWYELAHDRLIEPVRRDNAVWRGQHLSPFERAATLWEQQGKPDRLLLLGADLAATDQEEVVRAGALTHRQQEFLEASRRADKQVRREQRTAAVLRRSARRLRIALAVVTLLLVTASLLGVHAWRKSEDARKASDLTVARQLAARADRMVGTRPDLAILLGLQSLSLARGQDTTPPPGLITGLAQLTHRTLRLLGPEGPVFDVAVSPDGTLLATAGADATVRLWDTATGRPHGEPLEGHDGTVNAVAFSPDGALLATAGTDRTVRLWNITTGQPKGAPLEGHTDAVTAVAFSPDGALLATAGTDRTVRLWNTATGQPQGAPLEGHGGTVNDVAFSPDRALLATAGDDGTVRLWDTATGRQHEPLRGHIGTVTAVAFSPSEPLLASASDHGTVRLWDTATFQPHGAPLEGHRGAVTAVAFSPSEPLLASASTDQTVRLWDTATGRPHGGPLAGHDGAVTAVAFSPDASWLASAGTDRTARIWQVADTYSVRRRLAGDPGLVLGVAFSPDGTLLATTGANGAVRFWETATGQPRGAPLTGHRGVVSGVAFRPNGTLLATAGGDGTVRLWDVATGQPRGALTGNTGPVWGVAFSRNGALLATASDGGSVRIWDPATGQPLPRPFEGHRGAVRSVAFSPDATLLATAGDDRTVRLWDVATGQPREAPLTGHLDRVRGVAFSPNGRLLASASADGTVQLWDTATGRLHGEPLQGHTDAVNAVAFSPNGRLLASASTDQTVQLWNTATGRPDGEPLAGHGGSVNGVAFSRDGALLVSAGTDQTALLWYLRWWHRPPSDWAKAGCQLVNRNLSQDEWERFAGKLRYQRTCPKLPTGDGARADAPAAEYSP